MLSPKLFSQMMAMMCEVYQREQTKALMDIYYLVLQDMSDEDFKSSIVEILKTRKFATLPKPAEILEYARPNSEALALIAIDNIEGAIAKGGAYVSVTFEDRVINSIIDHLGGWVAVCKMDVDEWKWVKKEIAKMYEVYSKRENHPQHLIGLAEKENGYTNTIHLVKASYKVQDRPIIPALCDSKPINNSIASLVKAVRS